jgi:hypothetical protein
MGATGDSTSNSAVFRRNNCKDSRINGVSGHPLITSKSDIHC